MIVVDGRRGDEAADGVDEVRVAAHAGAQPARQAGVAAVAAAAGLEMSEPGVGIAAEAVDEGVVAEEIRNCGGTSGRHDDDVVARGVGAHDGAAIDEVELGLADAEAKSSDSEKFPRRNS